MARTYLEKFYFPLSKKKKWWAKSKPRKVVEKNSTSKYNGNGLTAALPKYKEVKNNDKENRKQWNQKYITLKV